MRVPDRLTLRDVSLINHVRTGNQNSLGAHGFPEVQVIGTHMYPFVFHETHGFSTDRQDGGIPDPSYSKRMVASQDLQFCANMPGAPGAPRRARDWWPLALWQLKKVTSKGKLVCPEVFGGGNRGRKVGFSSCHLQWNHAGVWRP
jgi:hypothetical protein